MHSDMVSASGYQRPTWSNLDDSTTSHARAGNNRCSLVGRPFLLIGMARTGFLVTYLYSVARASRLAGSLAAAQATISIRA